MNINSTIKALEETEEIVYVKFVADKGSKSCEECLQHNGQTYAEDDPQKPALPIHPNCRCRYLKLDSSSTRQISLKSATVRVDDSPGIGGIRISGIDDMLDKLEKQYKPGSLSELIISNHGEFPGQFEMGGKDRLEQISASQIARLKRLLAPDAIIDIRMCYGAHGPDGEKAAQKLANLLGCRVRAYANQVSPFGTRPAFGKNANIPWYKRPFTGPGAKVFSPEKEENAGK